MDFTITLTGTGPLLMHSSRLADPLDPAAKALKRLTGKRTKTDADYLELARVEWTGGMYFDTDAGPYVPADNLWRSLFDGSKKHKMGPKLKEGVLITTDVNPLGYRGPRDLDKMWADKAYQHRASVKVGTARTSRCRPKFAAGWVVQAAGILDDAIIDLEQLRQVADTAGNLVGLGDWRPRYGRYTATVAAA